MPQEIKKPPDNAELIDEVFYVWETRYGLFTTMTKEGPYDAYWSIQRQCNYYDTFGTLQCEQDGTLEQYTRVVGGASVGVDL